MKIAVLSGAFLSEKHLKRLEALGDVEIFPNTTTEEEAIKRLKGVDIAILNGFILPPNSKIIESTDKLKLIILPHTGFFMVDLDAANKKKIKVVNTPGFSKEAVAELVIGLMFAVNRKISLVDRLMRKSPFEMSPYNQELQKYWGFNIKGKTMGVIGLGRIGSTVAELALDLGMKVIANNRSSKSMDGVEMVSLKELLKRSDVVSVNVTSNAETENIISEKELNLMKPTAILINVDQAQQVNADAIYKALKENKIAGAALDSVVGMRKNHPILKLDNVVLTPHFGGYTHETYEENLPEIVVSNIEAFVKGKAQNVVNP